MPWIKIFISHSTKTEEAEVFLNAVKDALSADFDVRLDRTGLQGGDDWREKLYRWMDEAHGAVLLLTSEALKSNFVQLEASVLVWRRFRQPSFVLVPVLVGEVDVADISKGIFGEMELSRIQAVNLDDPGSTALELLRCLRELKESDTPRTPREVLENRVVKLLKKENTEEDLRDAGRHRLGWKNEDFVAGTDYYEKFARDLLGAEIAAACAAVLHLSDQGMSDALELLNLVVPAWVAEEDAKPIAQLALSELTRRAVSLNASESWVLHTYISRSCYTSLKHGLEVCELLPPSIEDSLAAFRQQILDYFKPTNPFASAGSPEKIKRLIEKRNEQARPVFVAFPPGWIPDAKILDALRGEFRTVTFFILTGEAPAEQVETIREKVYPLKPLDATRAESAYEEYAAVYDLLNR
ncbi:MAG: hypothetical protein QOJ70_2240 [Acidobacteriota bacterium]|jgi:hypothetical protein|nr:hypothetical protein [Acidobacteriota bacterium]